MFRDVEELRWRGPTPEFAALAELMQEPKFVERSIEAQPGRTGVEFAPDRSTQE